MFYEIFRFEIKRAFKRPAIYLYWFILFALAFLIMNAAGGAFESLSIHIAGDNVKVNAPRVMDILFGSFSYLGIFITAAICSGIVFKDFKYNTLELMFTTPIRKKDYIFGRFLAAYVLNIVAFTGVGLGFYLGSIMPYLNQQIFGEFLWKAYLDPYAVRILPNLFFVCAIFFSMSLLLRSVVVNWLSILGLYILYALGMNLLKDLDSRNLAALLDPFGIAASLVVTANQSANDMNNEGAQLVGVYFYNRLLWLSLGGALLTYCYYRFRFAYDLKPLQLFKRKNKATTETEPINRNNGQKEQPASKPFTTKRNNSSMLFRHLTAFEFKKLIRNVYFLLIGLTTVVFLFVASKGIGKMYDTQTYPVTYQVLDILQGSISLFLFIVIMVFSGEMIWSDREVKIHEIADTLPSPRWVRLASKFTALAGGIALLQLVMIGCGILFQYNAGYYRYEIGLYFQSVFGISFVSYLLLMVLAFLIHILVNNKYLGHVVLILYWVWDTYFTVTVLKQNFLVFNGGPSPVYSDMNQFGFELAPFWIYKIYWILFAGILIILANQFLVAQTETHWKSRFNFFRERFQGLPKRYSMVLGVIWLILGGYIYYNTNVLNDFNTPYESELLQMDYEKTYKKFEYTQQPKITDVSIEVDLFPESGEMMAKGEYLLCNPGQEAIDTLLINRNQFVDSVWFDRKTELIQVDKKQKIYLYHLEQPLQPGENLKLAFAFKGENKGFNQSGSANIAEKNGSFLYNSLFPSIGYNSKREIFSKRIREKHKLPERPIALKRTNPNGLNRNFITPDADFINFKAVVSTDADQTALTPGKLVKHWKENGRNYFRYESEHPMLHYYAILSGRYQVKKELWQPDDPNQKQVEVAVYYHQPHNYNLDNMIQSVKRSLSFYSKHYTPYQFEQLRIVEFPRHSTFAQSFPNMIPFSEGIGFIADLRELDRKDLSFDEQIIDYPFYVTAHEMAHQWWAHQVVAANVEGCQMLMESVTQFSALKAMENHYGKKKMTKFLQDEMFRYLTSRKHESHEERPLATVAKHQSDIYYRKGSTVLYALNEYLGDDKLLKVCQSFLKEHAFKGAPYPTTIELVERIEAVTPDSLAYYVEDALKKITLYQTKVDSATYQRNKNFTYQVDANISCHKYYANGKGKETETACADWVEIGIYNSKGKELLLKKVKLQKGENQIHFDLKRKPDHIVVDPYYRIVDKDYRRPEIPIEKS
ncbi:MAG: ABC transporter permease/M1 family aminopeptidase [Marinifilaceae bacterium]